MRFLLTETPYLGNQKGGTLGNSVDNFLMLIATLLVFVFVLVITYLCTRWIANYQRIRMKSRNLQILESIPTGNNKMICLVKTGKKDLKRATLLTIAGSKIINNTVPPT